MNLTLTQHEPMLVNTVGHSFGVLLFGLSLYFLLRGRPRRNNLSVWAAGLAFTFNLSSLLALAFSGAEVLIALSTSALSMLPAVLLHLSLGRRLRWVVRAGYGLGAVSVALHASEHLFPDRISHRAALLVTTAGFGALTLLAAAWLLRSRTSDRKLMSRLVGAMALFLFAMSFVHFGDKEVHLPWSIELIVHHAGIPLALIVLLQDYRFVLLDAFLRVLASLALAGAFIFAFAQWPGGALLVSIPGNPFRQGLFLVGACLALVLYAVLRSALQGFLTRILFRRPDLEATSRRLRDLCSTCTDEREYLRYAAEEIATFLSADQAGGPAMGTDILFPVMVSDLHSTMREQLEAKGVELVVPLRLAPEDIRFVFLGRRSGGRRYFSEDLQAVERLASQVVEHVEHFRAAEMQRLVAQAELKALESQIHPHFLFNALNTLYGVIPREAAGARRTVLNLADILRYFLQSNKTYIPLEEELRIVEAYLEIEKLRLGNRLRTRIDVDQSARHVPIPVLTLQPLVENAIKHAIASRSEGGEVRIVARAEGGSLRISVQDTGPGFSDDAPTRGNRVGLANVTRRLQLCYGPEAELKIQSGPQGTTLEFLVPWEKTVPV